MKRNKSITLENRRNIIIALLAFMVICVAIAIACFGYYSFLQKTTKEETTQYLQEISNQVASNAGRIINDNFSVLGTVASQIKSSDVSSFGEVNSIVSEQQKYWELQNIFLIDSTGAAHDEDGKSTLLSGDTYLQEAVVNRNKSMSPSQVIKDKECVVFAIPVDNIRIDGTEIVAMAASYNSSTFDQILALTAFGGQGYAHMVRRDGTMVVRSSSPQAPQSGYNLLNYLGNAQFKNGATIDNLKENMQNGLSGIYSLSQNGVDQYVGYTPLASSQEWYLMTFVSLKTVSARSQLMLKITLLLCAFISVSFALLLGFLTLSFYKHKRKLEKIVYVDPVTGGNTIQRFYDLASAFLSIKEKQQYALIFSNIEKFKVLNEQFGRNTCDATLCDIEKGISADLDSQECVGRQFADNFCILVKYVDELELLTRLEGWYNNAANNASKHGTLWLSPVIEYGVFVINNDTLPFNTMIDRAKLALRGAVREMHGKLRYAIYDDETRRKLFREKALEDIMEDALKNREFLVYIQPKYIVDSELIGGAEALVRWNSPKEGMIYPDEFISLFEKNGFIVELDFWVFEEVCNAIRRWLDAGLEPVKVSVNCSRIHLNNTRFIDRYVEICKKYNIPPKYIEIELTENVVFENVMHLTDVINQIHQSGFGCSMDDFGSGYSSLNLIQDIPVDTIKLDRVFFRSLSKDLARTESVVGSIITMAKSLQMEIVAEGVEERVHVDMLKRLNCDLIQGYYFARPMPMEQFEEIAFNMTAHNCANN